MRDKEWWIASLKIFIVIALIFGIIGFLGVLFDDFDTGSQIDDDWKPFFCCRKIYL